MKSSKNAMTRFAARQGLLLVLVSVLALEATSIVQYIFSYNILSQESNGRAQGQLEATALHITGVMDQVETAVKNNVWSVQQQISNVDSLEAISRRLVQLNPVICGSTVALVNKNVAPYCWDEGGEIKAGTLATEEYDYKHQEWFVKPLELRERLLVRALFRRRRRRYTDDYIFRPGGRQERQGHSGTYRRCLAGLAH